MVAQQLRGFGHYGHRYLHVERRDRGAILRSPSSRSLELPTKGCNYPGSQISTILMFKLAYINDFILPEAYRSDQTASVLNFAIRVLAVAVSEW